MSWEVMRSETGPCRCGQGTETFVMEMDDWNRTRSHIDVHCPTCRENNKRALDAHNERSERRQELHDKAQELAIERYRDQWLAPYAGLTKKQAWQRYTGGTGYPALGTFYTHIKHSGSVEKYLAWCFSNHWREALTSMGVKDDEIDGLMAERARIDEV
jgi:hypothetical protein